MTLRRTWAALGLAAAVGALSATPRPVMAGEVIMIDGSSTVAPITAAATKEFEKAKKDIRVAMGISGTGGGFKRLCEGRLDIANASRPISKAEMDACKAEGVEYYELPVAYDGIIVVVNPKNDWVKSFTVADLKKMWEPAAQGRISKWSQVQSSWPDATLKLYGAGSEHGTFDYFTEAVTGKAKSSRADYTASASDGMLVNWVGDEQNALGYIRFAHYIENQGRLRAVPIDDGKGPVTPSEKSIEDGSYQPLARPIFIYVNKAAARKPAVREYVEYYLKNGASFVKQAKYIPFSSGNYQLVLDHFSRGKTGSVFAGEPAVGVRVDELMRREAKL